MFTGIVEEIGVISKIQAGSAQPYLTIRAPRITESGGLSLGDSVAVNGVCLTVRRLLSDGFEADIMPITLSRTSLGSLRSNGCVNLERAVALGARMGGHMVTGHIDAVGRVLRALPDGLAILLSIEVEPALAAEMIERGSVAINGVSLTIANLTDSQLTVSLVTHTRKTTTLGELATGDKVNIETDMIGKYVRSFLTRANSAGASATELTLNRLAELGF